MSIFSGIFDAVTVIGPAAATNNALARFDGTTGDLIQNSVGILSDTGSLSGLTDITLSNISETTGNIFDIANADSLTTGSILNLISNSTDANNRNLVFISNTGGQNATCLFINQDKEESSIVIDSESTTTPAILIDAKCVGVQIDIPQGISDDGLVINHLGNGKSINVTSSANIQKGLLITANSLTTGNIMDLVSDSSSILTRDLAKITNDNTLATGATVLNIRQDAAQRALFIDQNADGISLEIDSEATTAHVISIISPTTTTGNIFDVDADALTTGKILSLISNSTDVSTRELVTIHNSNTAATGTRCLELIQDAANAAALFISDGALDVSRTATATSINTDGNTFIGVTDNSVARTITLDTSDVVAARIIIIKDEAGTAASANNITVATEGAETIDGSATQTISVDFGVIRVYSDGTNWFSF